MAARTCRGCGLTALREHTFPDRTILELDFFADTHCRQKGPVCVRAPFNGTGQGVVRLSYMDLFVVYLAKLVVRQSKEVEGMRGHLLRLSTEPADGE